MNHKIKIVILLILFSAVSCKKSESISKEEINSVVNNIEVEELKGDTNLQVEKINLANSDVFVELKIKEIKAVIIKDTFQSRKDRYSDYESSDGLQLIVDYDIKNISQKKISFNESDYTYNGLLYIIIDEPENHYTGKFDYNLNSDYSIDANQTVSNKMFFKIVPDSEFMQFGGFNYKSEDGQFYNLYFKIEKDINKPSTDKECYYKITEKVFNKIN